MVTKTCISCKKSLTNDEGSITFKCPKCGYEINRCAHCRQTSAKYKCPSCEFQGP